jgi:hypothetical protein
LRQQEFALAFEGTKGDIIPLGTVYHNFGTSEQTAGDDICDLLCLDHVNFKIHLADQCLRNEIWL